MRNRLCTLAICLATLSTANAATFSSGLGRGISVVDASGAGDYTSLAAAAADFSSYPGGCTGDWTLLIHSDLTETTSAIFGNSTNGHKVTVSPSPGTSPTLTYRISTPPATAGQNQQTWDGNIIIGTRTGFVKNEPNTGNYPQMDHFTINGWNGDSAKPERNLTIYTPQATGNDIPRTGIRVVGIANGTAIQNCTILTDTPGVTQNQCVAFTARCYSTGLIILPQRGKVVNCGLYASRGNAGMGVVCDSTGSANSDGDGPVAMEHMVVQDCDIRVSNRGVWYHFNTGGCILYNRIAIHQGSKSPLNSSDARPKAIVHDGCNSCQVNWTMNVIGNWISEIHSLSPAAIQYAIGVGGGATGEWWQPTTNVVNNMIGGYSTNAVMNSPVSWLCRGIVVLDTNSAETFNVYNNSISMADQSGLGAGTLPASDTDSRLVAISFFNANGFSGIFNFFNNVVSYRQHNGTIISSRDSQFIGGTLNFDYNTYDLGTVSGPRFAYLNGTVYSNLTAWQSAGQDEHSNLINPFAPSSGGHWISDSDQHFTTQPAPGFQGISEDGIVEDIDGQPRNIPPAKGADEYFDSSTVGSWNMY